MTLKNNSGGHGNRKEQRIRRKQRLKHSPPRQQFKVELIDGNFSHYPEGFCFYHQAFLTLGLIQTHRCVQRNCPKLRKVIFCDEEGQNKPS